MRTQTTILLMLALPSFALAQDAEPEALSATTIAALEELRSGSPSFGPRPTPPAPQGAFPVRRKPIKMESVPAYSGPATVESVLVNFINTSDTCQPPAKVLKKLNKRAKTEPWMPGDLNKVYVQHGDKRVHTFDEDSLQRILLSAYSLQSTEPGEVKGNTMTLEATALYGALDISRFLDSQSDSYYYLADCSAMLAMMASSDLGLSGNSVKEMANEVMKRNGTIMVLQAYVFSPIQAALRPHLAGGASLTATETSSLLLNLAGLVDEKPDEEVVYYTRRAHVVGTSVVTNSTLSGSAEFDASGGAGAPGASFTASTEGAIKASRNITFTDFNSYLVQEDEEWAGMTVAEIFVRTQAHLSQVGSLATVQTVDTKLVVSLDLDAKRGCTTSWTLAPKAPATDAASLGEVKSIGFNNTTGKCEVTVSLNDAGKASVNAQGGFALRYAPTIKHSLSIGVSVSSAP